MDKDSPFARFDAPQTIKHTTTVYVNYCSICHYVWKAPAEAKKCTNCRNSEIPLVLIKYNTEVVRM